MNRDTALKLVEEYTQNKNLIKHMLAVEAAMRAYARKFNEDEDLWGITGLVHDFDYEKMGTEHPSEWGYEILRKNGAGEEIIQAIKGHADRDNPASRPTLMDKTLFAVDELTGFIVACALPRPDQISGLQIKSIKKRLKDKSFARGVDREHVRMGCEELDIELDDHLTTILEAMQGIKDSLGLK
ncbi:HD domain-containing protein [Candidatus Dojkabacteria bacterium]|uniref:HD domain-containing protein n=1 Tax=Candidatus Dojkabacteria bacterium TaxID=2099670 RepID=A0A955HYF2_9BACT|nr:HD domain-containing protein [Candidatus Dojkabacteria bacterium]MCB9790973.1 HD domain-containing protein [Candidatus Nomurabacteria bacterium]